MDIHSDILADVRVELSVLRAVRPGNCRSYLWRQHNRTKIFLVSLFAEIGITFRLILNGFALRWGN